jgi:phage shock protein PspC (stress-responsive transcriptional regulator)
MKGATMNETFRSCPHCGGQIRAEAVLCRHCHRDLAPGAAPSIRGPWVRDLADRKIAGVSTMVARNLGLSPLVTRLLFLALAFFANGLGVLLYVLAWVATPLGFEGKAPATRWAEWIEGHVRSHRGAAASRSVVPRPDEPNEHRA